VRAFAVCPICDSAVRREQINFASSFPSSHCGNYLYVSPMYSSVHALAALGLGVLLLLVLDWEGGGSYSRPS
jgi:hypothetical protein